MSADCTMYRNLIPRAVAGDLGAEEQESLNLHLAECAPCSREQALYAETLRVMRRAGDVPVPKHFFVYREQFENPWQIFSRMSRAWQFASAVVILLLGVFTAAAATRLHVRAESGALILSFGEPALRRISSPPPLDVAAIEARIVERVKADNRKDKLELLRTLRTDIEKSNRALTERQRKILQAALSDVEMRLSGQVATAESRLEARSDKAIADLYQVVSAERATDLAVFDNRLNRLAVNGEIRGSQTDAILETLLQVADLNLK